ncbi:MAG TPA: hypothetical protein VGA36_06995 [Nitriliruptorales bacterium]
MSLSIAGASRHRPQLAAVAGAGLTVAVLVAISDRGVPWGVGARGVVAAATLTLHAVGIILVHRANGFLNVAQVQLGALSGTLFAVLVQAEPLLRAVDHVCPPCGVSDTGWAPTVNYVLALVLALGLSVALGWLMYVGVVKRFAEASRLMLTVASIFIVQILAGLQEQIPGLFLTDDQRTQGIVAGPVDPPASFSFTLGGVRFGPADVLLVASAGAVVVGLSLFLRRSATGQAIRAAAQDADRARTLGIDVARLHGRLWMLVGAVSGVAALTTVTSLGGDAISGGLNVTLLVRIFLVAVVARLVSLPLAAVGALALAVVTEVLAFTTGTTLLLDGALVVVVGGLLLLQRADRTRADEHDLRGWRALREPRTVVAQLAALDEVRRWRRGGALVLAALALGYPWVMSPSQTNLAAVAMIYAMVGLSLLVLTGWTGLVSLGQFAFAGVGAFVAAWSGLPLLVALPVGGLAGAVAAVIVGFPALRLRGSYLAVATLALALATSAVLVNDRYLASVLPETSDRPTVLGMDLDDQRVAYYLVLVVLGLAVTAVIGLRRSRTGRVLRAARDNPAATRAVGIDLVRVRLTAFALSGFLAAGAGVLFGAQQGGVRAEAFAPELSVTLFLFTIIGGLGAVAGPLLGFAYFLLVSLLSGSQAVVQLASGIGGLVLLLVAPGGLIQLVTDGRDALLRRLAERYRLRVPNLVADGSLDAQVVAPLLPRTRAGGGTAFVPRRYALEDQWVAEPDEPEVVRG